MRVLPTADDRETEEKMQKLGRLLERSVKKGVKGTHQAAPISTKKKKFVPIREENKIAGAS